MNSLIKALKQAAFTLLIAGGGIAVMSTLLFAVMWLIRYNAYLGWGAFVGLMFVGLTISYWFFNKRFGQ